MLQSLSAFTQVCCTIQSILNNLRIKDLKMKIIHCCLAAFYNDNYSYQENILPRMHKLQGHSVKIIASTEVFCNNIALGYTSPSKYLNEDGIEVHRIPYKKWLPSKLVHKLRLYKGLYQELCDYHPDFIFLHDAQFLSIADVVKYLKENPNVKINVDGHSDYVNSARGFISKNILHKIIYKYCLKSIEPYVGSFWGTLPNRVIFFREMYDLPDSKLKLLVMGADDMLVKEAKATDQRNRIRERFDIPKKSFLIVSGGKFTKDKHDILNIIDVIIELSADIDIRMLIFGSVSDENGFKDKFEERCDGEIIQYVGWLKGKETYNFFEAADLIIFSGLHSVLWEQAAGQGKPCIFRYIKGQNHIDLGGNCLFLHNFSTKEIRSTILNAINNYEYMKKVAEEVGIKHFSYFEIANQALK